MTKQLAYKGMSNYQPHFSDVATSTQETLTTKKWTIVCRLPLKCVRGSENSRLDHDGNLQRSTCIANVQNYGL